MRMMNIFNINNQDSKNLDNIIKKMKNDHKIRMMTFNNRYGQDYSKKMNNTKGMMNKDKIIGITKTMNINNRYSQDSMNIHNKMDMYNENRNQQLFHNILREKKNIIKKLLKKQKIIK